MIELRKSGVIVDPGTVQRLKLEFKEKHFVLLPKLVEPALLEFLLQRLEQGAWSEMLHKGIGTEIVSADGPSLSLLHFLANNPAFIHAVEQIGGCEAVSWFAGRVYRFIPSSGHYDSWHDDHMEGRQVGMSLNLSAQEFDGGIFELRERKSKRMLVQFANIGLGDATLFRISSQLEHQITDVTGEKPKTAFAGWFKSGVPDLLSRLRTSLHDAGL